MKYIEPWERVSDPNTIENELKRELSNGHILYEVPVTAIATNDATYDDFVFKLDGKSERYAFVHLTWSKEKEPEFPFTVIYENYQDLHEKCILPTHEDFIKEKHI